MILYVYFELEVYKNLLCVGQLLENDFKVIFEDMQCMINDASD